jgi:hypothetical protein
MKLASIKLTNFYVFPSLFVTGLLLSTVAIACNDDDPDFFENTTTTPDASVKGKGGAGGTTAGTAGKGGGTAGASGKAGGGGTGGAKTASDSGI